MGVIIGKKVATAIIGGALAGGTLLISAGVKKYSSWRTGKHQNGYDKYGFDAEGYNRKGFDKDGFDRNGYDEEGYDKMGFNIYGYDREGYDIHGIDAFGRDREGFDERGYDVEGFDRDGRDKEGYDREGFGLDGFNRECIDFQGYNRHGYNRWGKDRAGRNEKYYFNYITKLRKRLLEARSKMKEQEYRYAVYDARVVCDEALKLLVQVVSAVLKLQEENLKICEEREILDSELINCLHGVRKIGNGNEHDVEFEETLTHNKVHFMVMKVLDLLNDAEIVLEYAT